MARRLNYDPVTGRVTDPETGEQVRKYRLTIRNGETVAEGNGLPASLDPAKWEMLSIAPRNDAELADFLKRNPGTEVSTNRSDPNWGVPIAHSRQEKLRILRNEGFQERT